ncbi:MAG: glycosyltransferase [Bacteroidales bacterium]|nr:glycosyltransferase [Bacteroidales bacterium]
MKILQVITSLRTGGAEKLMIDLIPRLKERGLEVDLLLFDGTDTQFKSEGIKKGIKIFDLGIGGSVYDPRRLMKLIPFMRKYDIIHTHNTAPQFFVAFDKVFGKAQFVTTEHGGSNRRRQWKWFKGIDRWMYDRYDKVICISHQAEKNLRAHIGYSKSNIITINNGVDIKKYATATPSEELERLAPGTRKLIMVAGFRWEKDQSTLIRALNYLPDIFHLFLIGDGVRREELHKLTEEKGVANRVHFLGVRSDVPQLLHAADYVVMSSHFEGLSLSSVEGMSVGKPFIASDVDGLKEVVEGAGILFPYQHEKVLAQYIMELENDLHKYRLTSERCVARAQNYDISKMVDAYIKEYNLLISKSSKFQ